MELYRNEAGREPFSYFGALPMKGNSKLIAECSSYERLRFFGPHRADYVMAVIDAYEVEKVVPEAPAPPLRDTNRTDSVEAFRQYCDKLATAVRESMRSRALRR